MTYLLITLLIGARGPSRWDALLRPYPEARVDPREYRLGPGDSLRVTLFGSVSYTVDITVDVSGWVPLYGPGVSAAGLASTEESAIPGYQSRSSGTFLGKKYLSGLTMAEAEDTLRAFYGCFYRKTDVNLSLAYPRVVSVSVVGQVLNQGVMACSAVERLSDLIVKAGGATGGADLTGIRVSMDGQEKVFNLYRYFLDGDKSQNPLVDNDMTVFIPASKKTVVVSGAVGLLTIYFNDSTSPDVVKSIEGGRTVRVTWEEGDNVERAIKKAGGLMSRASVEGITIVRGGIRMAASLQTSLEPGDRVEVPRIPSEVYVLGEVKLPGAYQYSPGLTYIEYVSLAGPGERGYTKKFTVVKPDGSRVSVRPQDEAKAGDRIIVNRVAFLWYDDYLRVLSAVTTIIVTWLTLRRW
ncbi:MAG: SLBB domain-containing protein [candidate division WOR-3 bacterium]